MNILERLYPFDVRPRHRETVESYTQRLLRANFDTPEHRTYLTGLVTTSMKRAERAEAWLEVLRMKTKRAVRYLVGDRTAWLTHSDGENCEQCSAGLTNRWMCTLCSQGEPIEQHPHFDELVCVRHSRWVGLDTDVEAQHSVGQGHVEAALQFRKLRRRRLLDVRLFKMLTATVSTAMSTPDSPATDSSTFPTVIALARVITGESFAKRFFDPAVPFADAYQRLGEVVADALGFASASVTRAVWLHARPTVFAVRHSIISGEPFTLAWPHDLPLHRHIVEGFSARVADLEPFANYLAASGDTDLSAVLFGIETGQRVTLGPAMRTVRRRAALAICTMGHQFETDSTGPYQVTPQEAPRCPVCNNRIVQPGYNDLATTHSDVGRELAVDQNGGLTAEDVTASSKTQYIWRCPSAGHLYPATPSNRTAGRSKCPVCLGRLIIPGVNDITSTHPELVAEWHPSWLALIPPTSVGAGSDKQVLWLCKEQHIFLMKIWDRTHGHGCDSCARARTRASKTNLAVTHPELAAEWHPTWNGAHTPADYSRGSRDEMAWLCPFGHGYRMRIERRVAGYKCKVCSRRELVPNVNDLGTTDPVLSEEWHPYLNGLKEPGRLIAGTTKYWWRCLTNRHEEQQSVPHRRKSNGCIKCSPAERILNRT
ncbi:zinc-ribbon domain-containing protein [Diaminobutyricimonas sp. LJ205]|uniref:zinc-ribbon domain-containing protein n=1 Tax=Diaminobutyricimonas sp. LJ205 TaxID=2683590 RepID=UPI0012F4F28A|nr:zinc-ribbon domain-containing protein [Diaminobutyricimonas sp. LJ205]